MVLKYTEMFFNFDFYSIYKEDNLLESTELLNFDLSNFERIQLYGELPLTLIGKESGFQR